jgi:hypothetical protein
MTGNDFRLSVLDDTANQQDQIPKSQWNESEPEGDVIDYQNYKKRADKDSETILKGMEWTVVLTQYLFMLLTIVSNCVCTDTTTAVSLFNYVLTAAEMRIIRVGFVGFTIVIILGFACSAQAYPSGKWDSPLVHARLASARHRHDIYCFQSSAGMIHNKLFLDSDSSRTIIHDASMLTNVRPLEKAKTVQGLTGAQSIRYQGDLYLNMVNTTGKTSTVVIKDVYYNPSLHYNLVSVSDMADHDYTSTFSKRGASVQGPPDTFDLIKTSNVYLLPVSTNSDDEQVMGAFTGLLEEERMHYRLNHAVNPQKMVALSNTGTRGIKPDLRELKIKVNICQRANITRQDAPAAVTGSNPHDLAFDLVDMSKVKTITGCQYCTIIIRRESRFMWTFVHKTKDELPQILD